MKLYGFLTWTGFVELDEVPKRDAAVTQMVGKYTNCIEVKGAI